MIEIEKHPESGYLLKASQLVKQGIDEVFDFFSDARQLERITPPFLKFKILTPMPVEIKEGALLDYSIRLHMIPIRWRTEISVWEPPYRFVDQQLKGPYRKWHHEHVFESVPEGTLMHDRVHYEVPFGKLVHQFVVRNDLIRIFEYRQKQIEAILNERSKIAVVV